MTTLVPTLAGIAWDPQIRGILAVAVGALVLMGSIYLVLSTNLAIRLGFLVVAAAFFGWMAMFALIWWLTPPGNGPAGRRPAWEIEEVVSGSLADVGLERAQELDTSGLPPPQQVNELGPAEIERLNEQADPALGDWNLLPDGDPMRGEAESVVEAAAGAGEISAEVSTPDTFVFEYAFETGGKPEREGDSVWDRVSHTVTSSLRVTHPTRYAIVQLQPATTPEPEPGQPPPDPVPRPDAEQISVVLVRDLGQTRVPAALVTLGSLAMLGLLSSMLHQRDKLAEQHRSAPLPATTGPPNGGGDS